MGEYCGQDESGFAAIFLIESYRVVEDFENMEFWANEAQRRTDCITFEDPEIFEVFEAELERFRMGAVAANAEALVEAGDYEGAAQEYVRLANEYSEEEFAPLGLFNAGLIYEQNLQRFELAMRQFERLIQDYPESEWVDDSLVRIAVNSKKFFDFDRAIETFRTLHEIGYSDPERVEHPIIDAAELLEYSQRYEEAADAYMTFVEEHPDDNRAPAVMFKAAELLGESGDERGMINMFADFRSEYGNAVSDLIDIDAAVINSLYRTAEYYQERGEIRDANRYYDEILEEFAVRQPEDINSRYAAAGVIYARAINVFDEWDEIELGESVREQTAGLESRRAGMEGVVLAFDPVIEYGSADWTVCASFQQGRVFQVMADLLYNLPVPDFNGDIDAEDEYILMVEDFATQYEDLAIEQWETISYPLMQNLGVINDCTIDTTRQLNRYRGAQYPLYKEEIRHTQDLLFSPQIFNIPSFGEEEEEDVIELISTSDDDEEEESVEEDVVEDDPFAEDPIDDDTSGDDPVEEDPFVEDSENE